MIALDSAAACSSPNFPDASLSTTRLGTKDRIIPQEVADNEDPAAFLTSVEEIQRLTGLNLFHELPDDFEAAFEVAVAEGIW